MYVNAYVKKPVPSKQLHKRRKFDQSTPALDKALAVIAFTTLMAATIFGNND
jgi:hypothetical protein